MTQEIDYSKHIGKAVKDANGRKIFLTTSSVQIRPYSLTIIHIYGTPYGDRESLEYTSGGKSTDGRPNLIGLWEDEPNHIPDATNMVKPPFEAGQYWRNPETGYIIQLQHRFYESKTGKPHWSYVSNKANGCDPEEYLWKQYNEYLPNYTEPKVYKLSEMYRVWETMDKDRPDKVISSAFFPSMERALDYAKTCLPVKSVLAITRADAGEFVEGEGL